jgi:hypothetical protein
MPATWTSCSGITDPQPLASTLATADEPSDRISTASVSYRAA